MLAATAQDAIGAIDPGVVDLVTSAPPVDVEITRPDGSYGKDSVLACFSANTLVNTPNGLKPIVELEAGDEVFSFDFSDNEIKVEKVIKVKKGISLNFIKIDFDVESTVGHHFYDKGEKTWVLAGKIKNYSTLFSYFTQTDFIKCSYSKKQSTYNLEVSGYNNYFVGHCAFLVAGSNLIK